MGYIYCIVERTAHSFESVIAALKLRITNNIMWNKRKNRARLILQLEQSTLQVTSNAACVTENHGWYYSLKNAR